MRLRRTRVRIPPPPRAVRLQTCRSERWWRCTDTSQDTPGHEKTRDRCRGRCALACARQPADPFLDQVEELLTARPSIRRSTGELGHGFGKTFGPWCMAPTAARGRRRRKLRPPKISFEKFLCPVVSPCLSLCLAGTRCVPLDTTSDLERCHTDAPPWPSWTPTTTPCSKHSFATDGDGRSTTSWCRATAVGGAVVPSGCVASSSPVVREKKP